MRPLLVVSVHGVAPATLAGARAWCAELDRRGVPASLLVVPGPWHGTPLPEDGATVVWLRDRVFAGDEVLLHGWAHRAGPLGPAWRRGLGRVVAGDTAEFAALGEPEAYALIATGRAVLDGLDLPAAGFTPPGWLHSPGTMRALSRAGLRYTTSRGAVHDLRSGVRRRAVVLSHRPGTEPVATTVLERAAAATARRGGTVRIAVHPAALSRPGLRAATLRAVDAALRAGAVATTYGGLLASRELAGVAR